MYGFPDNTAVFYHNMHVTLLQLQLIVMNSIQITNSVFYFKKSPSEKVSLFKKVYGELGMKTISIQTAEVFQ